MQAKGVRFDGLPGEIQSGRPLLDGADAVFPSISGDEVATGISHDADAHFLGQFDDVPAGSRFVGLGMSGLIDAAVDASAHVFHEAAEEPAGHLTDSKIGVNDQMGIRHDEGLAIFGIGCSLGGGGSRACRDSRDLHHAHSRSAAKSLTRSSIRALHA